MSHEPLIGFAGLTHLGICSAVAAASKGFRVIAAGADDDGLHADNLAAGRAPIIEPMLDELLSAHKERLHFAAELNALEPCDIVYVAMDVPTDDQGRSDLTPIHAIISRLNGILREEAILVILCQVPPGFTRGILRRPEKLFYQVETLVFGRAIEKATQPERFIVGCADPSMELPSYYGLFLSSFACPILKMRYESAELTKISINVCLVASVTVANTLAELCDPIGAEWSEIAPALKLDRRIGPYAYLTPGLGISGGNLERDLETVLQLAGKNKTHHQLIEATIANSRHAKDWPWQKLRAMVLDANPHAAIAVLGVAYKENTASTKNSPSLQLLDKLKAFRGGREGISVYDPAVAAEISGRYGCVAGSVLEAVADADVVCLMTPWPEFRDITAASLADLMRGTTLIDPYGLIDRAEAAGAGFRHVILGARTIGG